MKHTIDKKFPRIIVEGNAQEIQDIIIAFDTANFKKSHYDQYIDSISNLSIYEDNFTFSSNHRIYYSCKKVEFFYNGSKEAQQFQFPILKKLFENALQQYNKNELSKKIKYKKNT